ncbi:MAG: hypothetical protein Q8N99_00460 [Nanoarchaeota archaeon]|nr:hypothetical protein [Nanoarchaeota archaeon]
MKKRCVGRKYLAIIFISIIILILSINFVSAGWFSDFIKNIFGSNKESIQDKTGELYTTSPGAAENIYGDTTTLTIPNAYFTGYWLTKLIHAEVKRTSGTKTINFLSASIMDSLNKYIFTNAPANDLKNGETKTYDFDYSQGSGAPKSLSIKALHSDGSSSNPASTSNIPRKTISRTNKVFSITGNAININPKKSITGYQILSEGNGSKYMVENDISDLIFRMSLYNKAIPLTGNTLLEGYYSEYTDNFAAYVQIYSNKVTDEQIVSLLKSIGNLVNYSKEQFEGNNLYVLYNDVVLWAIWSNESKLILVGNVYLNDVNYSDSKMDSIARAYLKKWKSDLGEVTVPSCTDSDGGKNYYIKGFTQGSINDSGHWDRCYNSTLLTEYYCEDNDVLKTNYNCKCLFGRCKNITSQNCTDSDDGINTKIKGTTSGMRQGVFEIFIDYCFNENYVLEGYCKNNLLETGTEQCPKECKDGMCIGETPLKEVNRCPDLSNEVKLRIRDMQTIGRNITLKEGGNTKEGNYMVIYNKNGGVILEVSMINTDPYDTSGTVEFTYVLTGERQTIILMNTTGTFIRKGVNMFGGYNYTISVDSSGKYVNITWLPENEIDTFYCEGDFLILHDYVSSYPNLVEQEKSVEIGYYISVDEKQINLVPNTTSIDIIKPSGAKESVSVYLYPRDPYCYERIENQIACEFYYSGKYSRLDELGIYNLKGTISFNKIKVVEKGYFAKNLVLHPDSAYTVSYSGYYHMYENQEELSADYYPRQTYDKMYKFQVAKFNSENESQILLERLLDDIQGMLSSTQDVNGNKIYVLKGLNDGVSFVLWKSGTNIILGSIGSFQSQQQNISIQEFINALSGIPKKDLVSLDYYDLDSLFRIINEQYFELYPSDLTIPTCIANWECEISPVVCPEYGKQIKTCIDNYCGKPNIILEMTCQPGICSGCMTPKKYPEDISRCIPYGFRVKLDNTPVKGEGGGGGGGESSSNSSLLNNNYYCDIDGALYSQKELELECQNNFECKSNQCSDGKCISLSKEIKEQTGILRKIWCFLTNMFNKEGYKQCIGEVPTGGGGGGGGNSSQELILYDDFSSGTLNTQKWEVRQDYEGWPFTEEYGVENGVFHTKQNTLGNAGTFLVPTHKFSAGETFEYDIIYNSGTGNRISMLLADRNRMGIVGNMNSEFTGIPSTTPYHVKMVFGDGFIDQIISNPNGIPLQIGDSPTSISRHDLTSYNELYIGVRTGHNGVAHFDYDNFTIITLK